MKNVLEKIIEDNLRTILGIHDDNEHKDKSTAYKINMPVLIRTYSAGVFFGILEDRNGMHVTLKDSRRIWSWTGKQFTLHAIANNGIKNAKLSEPLNTSIEMDAIEIIYLDSNIYSQMKNYPSYEC